MREKHKKQNNLWFDVAKWTAAIPMLVFFRPKKYYPFGKPNPKGKMIVSANHIGPLDCVKICFIFPWRRLWTVTRKECFEKPFKSWFFRAINCLPIDRENLSMDTYHSILNLLERNKMVLFFSEGRLNFNDNNVKEFKMGTVFFAAMANAPIVPIYIVRREKYMERTHIIVGEEIRISDYCKGMPSMVELEKINDIVRERECKLEEWKNEHLGK